MLTPVITQVRDAVYKKYNVRAISYRVLPIDMPIDLAVNTFSYSRGANTLLRHSLK
jgi:hypothetical protein